MITQDTLNQRLATLTERQRKVYDYIKGTILEKSCAPSVREICAYMHVTSPNGVAGHLKALEKKGVIERHPKISRAISLVGLRLTYVPSV